MSDARYAWTRTKNAVTPVRTMTGQPEPSDRRRTSPDPHRAQDFIVDVRAQLRRQGFAWVEGHRVARYVDLSGMAALIAATSTAPMDPYDPTRTRRRFHGRFVFEPGAGLLHHRGPVAYHQDRRYNPVDGGGSRWLPPLPAALACNPTLQSMIRLDWWCLPAPFRRSVAPMPVDVGVHLIAYSPTVTAPSRPSPAVLHKDGEPFTCVHHLGSRNVSGGESQVADNSKVMLFEQPLSARLETLLFEDERVYHGLKPVYAEGVGPASRVVTLVDFTPFFQPHARARPRWP
ncbi:MAG: 2OG-Fe dioxygenase family protein [Alphaproteobacteria bacterium]|nr:2OG-Fe dioxygenase family protein [Alphaproteobacteria bacterium]